MNNISTISIKKDSTLLSNESGNKYFIWIISIFEKNKIQYWVDQGTLLGIIRDKQIIPWEWDLDFGVFVDETPYNHIKKIFLNEGFRIEKIPEGNECIHFLYGNERKVDITFYKINNDFGVTQWTSPVITRKNRLIIDVYSVLMNNKLKYYDKRIIKRLILRSIKRIMPILRINDAIWNILIKYLRKQNSIALKSNIVHFRIPLTILQNKSMMTFLDTKIFVPGDALKYLEYVYGKNWKIPIKNYLWYKERTRAFK